MDCRWVRERRGILREVGAGDDECVAVVVVALLVGCAARLCSDADPNDEVPWVDDAKAESNEVGASSSL